MASVAGSLMKDIKEIRKFWADPSEVQKNKSVHSDLISPDSSGVEEVSTSITQTWTDQAIKCYLTNADCANCSIPRGRYSFECQMNKVVPVLLKTLGQPDENRINKLLPYLPQY